MNLKFWPTQDNSATYCSGLHKVPLHELEILANPGPNQKVRRSGALHELLILATRGQYNNFMCRLLSLCSAQTCDIGQRRTILQLASAKTQKKHLYDPSQFRSTLVTPFCFCLEGGFQSVATPRFYSDTAQKLKFCPRWTIATVLSGLVNEEEFPVPCRHHPLEHSGHLYRF